ncbi:response regulator [Oryzibacter oryziterrae]|uniref:response regulator n=1 Tax=Oryzibacter oryziterrae TaxID=2766474 RepID=UPI001F029C71|nr:response regulator [Oryzibacter oryziterrae]
MTQPRDVVLIVDDSPEALGFLTEALEAAGITALVATSGAAALAIVERAVPDVILMDAVMPGLDGFETCRRLKAGGPAAHVPVIFMTGLSDTEHVVKGLESGGVDYLTKPINLDELRARIRVHLANARASLSARIALDAAGRHLIAFGRDGALRWLTPQATRLIEETGGQPMVEISPALSHLIAGATTTVTPASLDLAAAGLQGLKLAYLGSAGAEELLFRLTRAASDTPEEILKLRFGLTQREAEVLVWIGHGKANKDIGDILDLSPRTVNKHLEQIYVKLGVENRASAAVMAMEALREP